MKDIHLTEAGFDAALQVSRRTDLLNILASNKCFCLRRSSLHCSFFLRQHSYLSDQQALFTGRLLNRRPSSLATGCENAYSHRYRKEKYRPTGERSKKQGKEASGTFDRRSIDGPDVRMMRKLQTRCTYPHGSVLGTLHPGKVLKKKETPQATLRCSTTKNTRG